jgi:hypothetical protein
MAKYKNVILIILAIILLIYAGFISIYPIILTKTFDTKKFAEKVEETTSLKTTVDAVEYKIKPNFDVVISLRNWSSKYVDGQNCFDATLIEITTTPNAIFNDIYTLKKVLVKNAKFSNQILPSKANKLAFLPKVIDPKVFGVEEGIIVKPAGPVIVKNFRIKYIGPHFYKEDNRHESKYSAEEVRNFLKKCEFTNVVII